MKDLSFAIAALFFVGLAPACLHAEELWQHPLDRADSLGTRISEDSERATQGTKSARIESGWPTVINLAEVTDVSIENAILVFEADLRSEGLVGAAFLEMWCIFPDGGQYFSRGLDSTVSGDVDWRRVRTKFVLQKGQRPQKIVLNLVLGGPGTVWVDNLKLTRQPLP